MDPSSDETLNSMRDEFFRRMEERKELTEALIKVLATRRIMQDLFLMHRPVEAPLTLAEQVCKQVVRILYPQKEQEVTSVRASGTSVVTDVIYVVSESGAVEETADEATKKEKRIWIV